MTNLPFCPEKGECENCGEYGKLHYADGTMLCLPCFDEWIKTVGP